MAIQKFVAAAALVGLTACGGGGGSLGSGVDLGAGPGSYGDLDGENDRFISFILSADSTSFPSNSVEYDGVILMGTDLDPGTLPGSDLDPTDPTGYIGQVNLTADFSGPFSVTGTATNFFSTNIDSEGNPGGSGSAVANSGWVLSSSARTNEDFVLAVSGTVEGRNVIGDLNMKFKDSVNFVGTVDAVVGVTDPSARLIVTGAETTTYDAFLGAD